MAKVVTAVADQVDRVDAQPEGIDQCFQLVSCCLCFDAVAALGFGIDLFDTGPLRHGRVVDGSIMFRLTLDAMQTVQESTTGRGKRCRFVVWICLECVSSCICVRNG